MSGRCSGQDVAVALEAAGFTHVVWLPDSHIGRWEEALESSPLALVRVTREGEAIALAAGLMLGGARPIVMIQCTGLFEAGDALRNVVYDLQLPLKLLVGVRNGQAFLQSRTNDSAARFTDPIVRAWGIPMSRLNPALQSTDEMRAALGFSAAQTGPIALLWQE